MARPKLSSSVKKSSKDVPKAKCQSKFRKQKANVKVVPLLTGEGIVQVPSDQLPANTVLLSCKIAMPRSVKIKISETRGEYFEEDVPLKLEFEDEDADDDDDDVVKDNWMDEVLPINYEEERRLQLESFKQALRSALGL